MEIGYLGQFFMLIMNIELLGVISRSKGCQITNFQKISYYPPHGLKVNGKFKGMVCIQVIFQVRVSFFIFILFIPSDSPLFTLSYKVIKTGGVLTRNFHARFSRFPENFEKVLQPSFLVTAKIPKNDLKPRIFQNLIFSKILIVTP